MAKAVLIDLRRCIGCRACQVACKRWNDRKGRETQLNADPVFEWTNPSDLAPQTYTYVRFVKTGDASNLKWTQAKIQCNHCIVPSCANACPSTALIKTDNGPVVYRKELCIGCRSCVEACPFGVPQWDAENRIIEKCTFCSERLAEGLMPACVQVCPTDTLKLMDLGEAQTAAQKAELSGLYTYGLHEVGGTSWIYISEIPFTQLSFVERTDATPIQQHEDILTNFGTIGIIGGLVLSGIAVYSNRVKANAEAKKEET